MEKQEVVLAAVIGNKNWEVGIAAMNLGRPILRLSQISDNRKYDTVHRMLEVYNTTTVLLPASHMENALAESLLAEETWHVQSVPRRCFSEDSGMEKLNALSVALLEPRDLERRHLARAAAAALLKTVEQQEEAIFERDSLMIKIDDLVQGRLVMDAVSVRNLELLANRKAVLGAKRSKDDCLLAFMDDTVTKPGHRLLRSEIASPLGDLDEILERQEMVEELLNNAKLLGELRDVLSKLHDTDQITTHYAVRPKSYTMLMLKREADNFIKLRQVLEQLTHVESILCRLKCSLAKDMAKSFQFAKKSIVTVLAKVNALLNPNATYRRSPEEQREEALFCLREGMDGILDVARLTYHAVVAEMKTYVENLNEKYPALDITLRYTARRGYYLRVPKKGLSEGRLDGVFIRPAFHKKNVDCTTEELENLNLRQEQAATEAFRRTEVHLAQVRELVKQELAFLYDLSDTLALCDVIQSLAYFSSQEGYIKPTLFVPKQHPQQQNEGEDEEEEDDADDQTPRCLELRQSRHPLLENALSETGEFVSNDLVLGQDETLVMVMGPNCAGKSTLLRQVALSVIFGHLGAYVPAKVAHLPLVGRIFTRIGTEDNLEANASTFSLEMTETAYILCSDAQEDAFQLVLVDELGRGTSTLEGFGIAYAVAEFLKQRQNTLTLFTTHFQLMSILVPRVWSFPTSVDEKGLELVQSYHLEAVEVGDQLEDNEEVSGYGIRLAEKSNFPKQVIEDAKRAKIELRSQQLGMEAQQQRIRALLYDHDILPMSELRKELTVIQEQYRQRCIVPVKVDGHM